jgi:threonine synthase
VTAWWKGFVEYGQGRPVLYGFQAEGAAPIVLGHAVEKPETVASAIRIGNPGAGRRRRLASTSPAGRSRPSDQEILDAQRWLASTEGVLRAGVGRVRRRSAHTCRATRRCSYAC